MPTQPQIDAAMQQMIAMGIAKAREQETIFTRPLIDQVESGLNADLPGDEDLIGKWFDWCKTTYGWRFVDAHGGTVTFPQKP